MRNMSKIFTEAHRITREIKAQYPAVDYRTQFSLNLSYLLNSKEDEQIEGKKRIQLGQNSKKVHDYRLGIDVIYDGVVSIEHETEKALLVQFMGTITDIWYDGEEEMEEREEQTWVPKSVSTVTENTIYIEEWFARKRLSHCLEKLAK